MPIPVGFAVTIQGSGGRDHGFPSMFWMIKNLQECGFPKGAVLGVDEEGSMTASPGKADDVARREIGQDQVQELWGQLHEMGHGA